MAIYRQIQTTFWQDDFVLQLTPEEKYFYLFLLTNSKTKQCGIYQLPMPIIIVETGYNQETVEKLLHRFIDYGKIIYSSRTKEIGIVNWPKYNPCESPKVRVCVQRELKDVKDRTLIDKLYPIDRVSQQEEEQEKEKAPAEAEEKEPANGLSSAAADIFTPAGIQTSIPPLLHSPDDQPDYNCQGIQYQSEMLLTRIWNKPHPTQEEIRFTVGYIKLYGFEEVETAFREAVKYDKKRLAYVESICQNRKDRSDMVKKTEAERQKRLEQDKKLEEERKSGVGLGLIKTVFGDG
jgi:hypothetical protein